MIIPFPESSLNEEAGKIFMENYEEYFKIASIYTNVHAGGGSYTGTSSKIKNVATPQNCNNNNINTQNSSEFNAPSTFNGPLNFNLLRHSKSVTLKNSQQQIQNIQFLTNNNFSNNYDGSMFKLPKKNSNDSVNNSASNSENYLQSKPNLNSLPYLIRSNQLNKESKSETFFNSKINMNSSEYYTQSPMVIHSFVQNSGSTDESLYNSFNLGGSVNQTPKSKKDEIKKWMNRI